MLVDLNNLILGKFYLNLVHTCAIFLCADWRMSIWTTWVTIEQWKPCLCHSRNFKGKCFDFQQTGVTCEFPTISSIEPYQSRAMAFEVHPSKWGFLFLKILGLSKCFIYKLVLKGTYQILNIQLNQQTYQILDIQLNQQTYQILDIQLNSCISWEVGLLQETCCLRYTIHDPSTE
jgi:hypothetical protein